MKLLCNTSLSAFPLGANLLLEQPKIISDLAWKIWISVQGKIIWRILLPTYSVQGQTKSRRHRGVGGGEEAAMLELLTHVDNACCHISYFLKCDIGGRVKDR